MAEFVRLNSERNLLKTTVALLFHGNFPDINGSIFVECAVLALEALQVLGGFLVVIGIGGDQS
jgi:hypothetical protein